ncbi:MAG TPA: hypothetical protein ACFCUY_14025 [Xenococcaceae cyanobacterium]
MKVCFWLKIPLFVALSWISATSALAGLFDRPDFFEKGRDQFEAEVRRFEETENTDNSSLTIEQTVLPWSRILVEAAGFTVMLPSGAITRETEVVEAPRGDIEFDIIASHPAASRYVIAYSEAITAERLENTPEVLEQARDQIISNNVGLLKIAEDDFTWENYSGKQFQLQNQAETIVFRLLVTENRFYVLAVNQQNDAISPDSIDTFFNSFELID